MNIEPDGLGWRVDDAARDLAGERFAPKLLGW